MVINFPKILLQCISLSNENQIQVFCFLNTEKDAILYSLYLPPYYIGKIKTDFQRALSQKELTRFWHLVNFKISFAITKNSHLSDIKFYTSQLKTKDKEIILRAFSRFPQKLESWSCKRQNNKDNYYSIESDQLFRY